MSLCAPTFIIQDGDCLFTRYAHHHNWRSGWGHYNTKIVVTLKNHVLQDAYVDTWGSTFHTAYGEYGLQWSCHIITACNWKDYAYQVFWGNKLLTIAHKVEIDKEFSICTKSPVSLVSYVLTHGTDRPWQCRKWTLTRYTMFPLATTITLGVYASQLSVWSPASRTQGFAESLQLIQAGCWNELELYFTMQFVSSSLVKWLCLCVCMFSTELIVCWLVVAIRLFMYKNIMAYYRTPYVGMAPKV